MKEACSYEPPVMALQNNLKAIMLIPPEQKALPGRPKKRKSRYQAMEAASKRRKSTAFLVGRMDTVNLLNMDNNSSLVTTHSESIKDSRKVGFSEANIAFPFWVADFK